MNENVPSQPERTELLQSLLERFAISDLKLLCFNLVIEYEDLPGESRKDKARELIQYMERNGRLPELATAVESWPFPKGVGGEIVGPLAPRDRALDGLLKNVQATWIDGVLHQSLQTAVLLQLGLAYAPHAISRSQPYVLRQEEQPETPVDKPIIELFDAHGRNLLILGAPGSGKTFTLLQLAEMFIQQAEVDPRLPVPIVLNLSSWADKRGALLDWAALEMNTQYSSARKVSRAWLEQNELVLLLDGLDEVDEAHRDDCITAINEFKAAHTVDVVVCSRIADYERLQKQLNLNVAVTIQPVTESEIDRYLAQEELELKAVRATLKTDADMRELSQSPLMLTIMTLAYRGMSGEALRPLHSMAARRHHLFTEYVARVFERRPLTDDGFYDQSQALQWLSNLARNMQREKMSVFFIERLQPTWLDSYRPYMGLVGAIVGLIVGLIWGPSFGLINGLIFGLIGGTSGIINANTENNWFRFIGAVLIVGLINGLISGLFAGLELNLGVELGFEMTWGWGLFFGLIVGIVMFNRAIVPIEVLTISFPSNRHLMLGFGRGFLAGLVVGMSVELINGLIIGLNLGLIFGLNDVINSLELGLQLGLQWGLIFGIIFGMVFSATTFIQVHQIEKRLQPNEGIRSSLINAFRMLLLSGLLIGLVGWLLYFLLDLFILIIFLALFPTAFFYYGGGIPIKHYVLRFLLARKKTLPFRLVSYLDGMTDRILLRKVGGGYIFIHRMLLEYFAELATEGDAKNIPSHTH